MSNKLYSLLFLAASISAPSAFAQKWEVGAGVGGSFYTSQSFSNAVSKGDASLSNGISGSVWLGNNSGTLLGGEVRYDYESSNPRFSANGSSVSFGGDTHAIHYDFLLHFTPRESRIRPYVAAGGGIKVYRGTGRETSFQPLSSLALLTKTNQIEGLVSVGAGIKFAIAHAFQLRIEVHDYLTPFPNKVIVPALGSKVGGWLQDFVPSAGVAITF